MFGSRSRRPREKRHIFREALIAEGNESYIHIGASKLRETNPTSFRETRLRESKPRAKLCVQHSIVFVGIRLT